MVVCKVEKKRKRKEKATHFYEHIIKNFLERVHRNFLIEERKVNHKVENQLDKRLKKNPFYIHLKKRNSRRNRLKERYANLSKGK